MGEIGEVIGAKDNIVTVKLKRTEACAKCRVCAAGMQTDDMIVDAINLCGAKIGEKVHIEIDGGNFLLAVIIMYGIPCVSLITGFVAGYYASLPFTAAYSEIAGFILGILFVTISFLWIRKNEAYWKSKNFSPKAVKIEE